MHDLHQELLSKNTLYRKWHAEPMHKTVHWSVFVAVSILVASSLVTKIQVAYGQTVNSTAYGDSVLHLGSTGYAMRPSSSVTDLDYSKDFSVETIVDIPANTPGGRWAMIMSKTGTPTSPSAGFAVGLDQGHFQAFGQIPYAQISDGTNSIQLNTTIYPTSYPWAVTGGYEGETQIVITWNASTKTMSLYADGNFIKSQTNSSINPLAIANTFDLRLGGAYGNGTFGRDIILARLWNRGLTGTDVTNLYSSFYSTGSHLVPSSVSRTNLISEWMMAQASDVSGNIGTTHIRDTAGNNHLQLLGGALLFEGDGALTMQVPANGSNGVSPAVILRATGGLSNLPSGAAKGLSYQFQIDEASSFNSTSLKDSGWIKNTASWKPVLKPATVYYWHVRVKDSSLTPNISSYTQTNTFTTRSSVSWFARPGVFTGELNDYIPIPQTGVYGSQNGTSYANAWNGVTSIVWGENGVAAGDNLYVCGTHVYSTQYANFTADQANEYIRESGYSSLYPITIRMDCPGDTGTLWGTFNYNVNGGATWTGPDANGVYSSKNFYSTGAGSQMLNNIPVWLEIETAPTWVGHAGATYFDSTSNTTYVKTVDGSNPTGKIQAYSWGYRFDLNRQSYIKFYKTNFLASLIGKERLPNTMTVVPPSHDITIDSSVVKYIKSTAIPLYGGNNNWTVKDSDISFANDGVYTNGMDTFGGVLGAQNLHLDGNKIHDIGIVGFGPPNDDCHGIGIQAGKGHLIENNEIWNTGGTAIEFWTAQDPMQNMIVRNNFIHDIHVRCMTSSDGIVVSGDGNSVLGVRTGFKIYGNIVANTGLDDPVVGYDWRGWGYGSSNIDYMEVYNNIFYNTRGGMSSHTNFPSNPIQGAYYNNMVIKPWGGADYVQFSNGNATNLSSNLYMDNNLYFPATGPATAGLFNIYPLNSPSMANHDTHSIFADPQFVSADPKTAADFALKSTSPAINMGKDVGITSDFIGTIVPQGSAPDIGAFEFMGTVVNNPPTANSQTLTTPANTPLVVTLTGSDPNNRPLTYSIVSNPTHGTLTGTGANQTYTPTINYSGADTFTFKANNGTTDSNIAAVSITVTSLPSDTTPPVISAVTAGNITSTGSTITWTTDEAASSQVQYGLSTSYGSQTGKDSTLVTAHSQVLSNFTPATFYHYRVMSSDAAGNTSQSADYQFTTLTNTPPPPPPPADTTPPTAPAGIVATVSGPAVNLSWSPSTDDVAVTGYNIYRNGSSIGTSVINSFSDTAVSPGNTYTYTVTARDAAGNVSVPSDQATVNIPNPQSTAVSISSNSVSKKTATTATIIWTTNVPSIGVVTYGTSPASLNLTANDVTSGTNHTVFLTGLTKSTKYYYTITATAVDGNSTAVTPYTMWRTQPK